MDFLPPEIISKILSYLDTDDLLNARLVNKLMYEQTCVLPLSRRFRIVIKPSGMFPSLYKLQPQHVEFEDLGGYVGEFFETNFKCLETLKFYNCDINISVVKYIATKSQLTIQAIEFKNCLLQINMNNAEFNLNHPNIQFSRLTRLKIDDCELRSHKIFEILINMTPKLYEFSFRSKAKYLNLFDIIYENLKKNQNTIGLLALELEDLDTANKFFSINFKNLKTLKLISECQLLEKTAKIFRQYRLKTLKLHFTSKRVTMDFNQNFQTNVYVEHLCLKELTVDDETFNLIRNIPNIKILELNDSFFHLNFNGQIPVNTNMKALLLEDANIFDVKPSLVFLWPNIKYLDVSGCYIDHESLKYICLNLKELVALKLDLCWSGEYFIPELHFNELKNLSNLKYLSLSGTSFSDRVCDYIKFPKLEVIHLFPNITSEGLRILGENNPRLKVVCPDKYNMIKPEEMFNIQDYFPNCSRFICKCRYYFREYLHSL